ncbi:MAG: hypothetical protein IT405_02890 [Candidatus Yanofskybacteria bacterium]|nr:hypothetical protein [Candidatus Yanofskybacteria bacterium]
MRLLWTFVLCAVLAAGLAPASLSAEEPMLTSTEVATLPYGTSICGISTLDPTGPKPFRARLLGVLRNTIGPGHDWIAAELDGATNPVVAGGQSGSPMYIDRDGVSYKVGTLSYGDSWEKNPVCYLTPIHEVLAVGDGASQGTTPATPMSVSLTARRLLPENDSLRIMLDGPSTSGVAAVGDVMPVTPGSVLGVQLAWGDFDITSYGTVSHVNGSQIHMFGHPFMQLGPAEYRLVPAKVLTVVQRYSSSYILAAPIYGAAPVGIITQDRETAISGILGAEPENAIPVEISMITSRGEQKSFKFHSIADPTFAPRIIGIGITTALQAYSREVGDMTVFLSGKVEVDGVGDIEFSDSFSSISGGGPFGSSPFSLVRDKTDSVLSNRFSKAKIKKVSVSAKVFDEYRKLSIDSASLERPNANPGETVKLRVTLSQPLKDSKTIALDIPLPSDLQFGVGKIIIGGAEAVNGIEGREGSTVNLTSLVESLNQKRRPDAVYVYIVLPPSRVGSPAVTTPVPLQVGDIAGEVLRTSKRLSSNVEEYEIVVRDFQVTGKQEVELKIGASGVKPPGHP